MFMGVFATVKALSLGTEVLSKSKVKLLFYDKFKNVKIYMLLFKITNLVTVFCISKSD